MRRHWKFWLLVILAGLLLAAVSSVVTRQLCQVPLKECSAAYQRYHNVHGIHAIFIKDKPINDSVAVDVTLLTATDTAAWDRLMADFNIPQYPPEVMALVMQGDAAVTILPFDRDSLLPHDDGPTTGSNLLVTYSYKLMSVCLFTIDEEAQIDAIIHHSVNKL